MYVSMIFNIPRKSSTKYENNNVNKRSIIELWYQSVLPHLVPSYVVQFITYSPPACTTFLQKSLYTYLDFWMMYAGVKNHWQALIKHNIYIK